MKRFVALLLVVLLLAAAIVPAFAIDAEAISPLRAGGGSSSGGGGGSGGGGSSSTGSHGSHSGRTGRSNPFASLVILISILFVSLASALAFRLRLSKYARNTKKLLALLERKDSAWKFKHIQKQVKATYFAVQKAWTKLDMTTAKSFMSDELFESFQTRLKWMKMKKERNVLKKIKLIEAVPVSVYDDKDDTRDHVWFYIKGNMVDYTVNTETNMRTDGDILPKSFCEYWQFTRRDSGVWVLNLILQEDEADNIAFTADS